MKWKAGVLVVVFLLLAVLSRQFVRVSESVVTHDSLTATKREADALIHEAVDSGAARVRIVYVKSDASLAKQALARLEDSLAAVAIQSHDFELAYRHEKARGDTLESALKIERGAKDDALAGAAYYLAAFIADSTRRAAEWENAQRLATDLKRAAKRSVLDYVVIGCVTGMGSACGVGFRVPLGR